MSPNESIRTAMIPEPVSPPEDADRTHGFADVSTGPSPLAMTLARRMTIQAMKAFKRRQKYKTKTTVSPKIEKSKRKAAKAARRRNRK